MAGLALVGAGMGVAAGELVAGVGGAVALLLSESDASQNTWRFDVSARSSGGRYHVVRILSRPPVLAGPGARLVAVLRCPGVLEWSVSAFGLAGARGELELAAGPGDGPAVDLLAGTRLVSELWPAPALAFAAQGVISSVPCTLLAAYGQLDPASPGPAWIGIFDVSAPLVGGEVPRVAPVRVAAGAAFSFDFRDGLGLDNGARWAFSTVPGTFGVGAGLQGLVQGEIR